MMKQANVNGSALRKPPIFCSDCSPPIAPMIEPAPPRFSTTIGWPMVSLTRLATMRATAAECRRLVEDKFASLTPHAAHDHPHVMQQTRASMQTTLGNMLAQFQHANAALVAQALRAAAKRLVTEASDAFDTESLPQTMRHLEVRAAQLVDEYAKRFRAHAAPYVGIAGVEEERLRFLQQCNEERAELFRRNHVKYDHLIANSLPALQPAPAARPRPRKGTRSSQPWSLALSPR